MRTFCPDRPEYERFSPRAWLAIIEKVFDVEIKDTLDAIDISWVGLVEILDTLPPRDVTLLKLRYVDDLSFRDIGEKLPRVDGTTNPIDRAHIGTMHSRIIQRLRHPYRVRMLKQCVAGGWMLQ